MAHCRTLEDLILHVGQEYRFTQDKYPAEDLSTEEKRNGFALTHSAIHMSKTTGRIAALAEPIPHGKPVPSITDVEIELAKQLANTLALAAHFGVEARVLISMTEQLVK